MKRFFIKVSGIVQGVGFRPFVFNLAEKLSLKGNVKNTSEGVLIDIEGQMVEEFIDKLKTTPPPLAKIDSINITELPLYRFDDFQILDSDSSQGFTLISPDISICDDCLMELLDENNRRFHYPFINCTNCGPRYSITQRIPYDRPNTTMASFRMCKDCLNEYNNPRDRRFHAQPNACEICGPHLSFELLNKSISIFKNDNPLTQAVKAIKQGAIIAIKGIGGFHLCCDALNENAVSLLRQRKRKSNKPFAIMLPDINRIKLICHMVKDEEIIVSNNKKPILLLKKNLLSSINIAPSVSPNNRYYGCMLPYTPLHYLLFFSESPNPSFEALVMTSGNRTEEPIVKDNEEALIKLSPFVDGILSHNRDIFTAIDDTVMRVETICNKSVNFFIRRARGYVPEVIDIHEDGIETLGVGADIKNSFAITKGRFAIMSQHIGDMENEETLSFFEETLKNLSQVYNVKPNIIGYDMNPNYLSTKWAERYINEKSLKGYSLQHHHCHICSVIAENSLKGKVIGVAFDGAGYGTDNTIWGSEFLLCEDSQFIRLAHFDYINLPGGDQASRQCWRPALSLLRINTSDSDYWSYLEKIGVYNFFNHKEIETLTKMIDNKIMSPMSTGAGRYFDAISALTGTCYVNTFEGESAIALESLTEEEEVDLSYQYDILKLEDKYIVKFQKTIHELLDDIFSGLSSSVISCKFHNTISNIVVELVFRLSNLYNTNQIALSGGVFQNSYLLKRITGLLINIGLKVYFNRQVPCNDAGIALGQVHLLRKLITKK
ncbi:MAG TPA: carbamoyltransferase HypF [Nitrospirae bacterium]|nr:carbamoyltransferase HypF [Nitrospirota bacterium]